MGPLRDPFVAVWAGIDPSRNRLMIRMGLEPPGRIWEVSVGSRKNGKFDGRKKTNIKNNGKSGGG